ncbi:MAG: hypothetical protein HYY00_02710 [Chloroflexi bacterium]|nr:hypothetical protein [Chloroflexota bacterium]
MGYTEKEIHAIEREEPLLQPAAQPARLERPKRRPMSNLNIRMPGEELARLSREAQKMGMNPTQLARRLITEGLDRLEGHPDLPSRVQHLEAEVSKLRAVVRS